jgi:hypothetical protein
VDAVIHAITTFTDLFENDDPYGEHDFGRVTIGGGFGRRFYFQLRIAALRMTES